MRRAIRRAGLALVAAGTLGITLPAVAGKPPVPAFYPVALAEESTSPQVIIAETGDRPEQGESQDRFLAVKVELALLADPMTFPYPITAEAVAGNVTLKGFVLNDVVRKHALVVAQQAANGAVADQLQIHTGLPLPAVGVPEGELQTKVLATLKREFPERGRFFGVQMGPRGQVTLTGSISSYEEKLAVSKCLRKVEGCQAVANNLQVPTIFQKGRFVAALSADGRQVVAADSPGEEATEHVAAAPAEAVHVPEGQTVALGPNVEPVTGPSESWAATPPVHPAPFVPGKETITRSTFSAAKISSGPGDDTHAVRPAPAPERNPNVPGWTGDNDWRPNPEILPPSSHVQSSTAPAPVVLPGPVPVSAAGVNGFPARVVVPGPLPEIREGKPAAEVKTGPQEIKFYPGTTQVCQAAPRPMPFSPLPASTWSQPASRSVVNSPATPAPAPVQPGGLTVSSSSGPGDRAPARADFSSASPPAAPETPAVSVPSTPYVTTGVVIFSDDEEPGPTTTARPEPGDLQIRLKHRIEQVCDGMAPDIEVVVRSPKSLLVRLRVLNRSDAQRLSQRILALKELGPYQVDLEVRLAHK